MRDNFEDAVACLLPVCPCQKYKCTNSKERQHRNVSEFSAKAGKGTSGVEYRWYKRPEYEKLSKEQRTELYTWQQSREGKDAHKKEQKGPSSDKTKDQGYKKAMKKTIKSLMAANDKVQEQMDNDMFQIASAIALPPPTTGRVPGPPASIAPTIASFDGILQRIADRKRKRTEQVDEE